MVYTFGRNSSQRCFPCSPIRPLSSSSVQAQNLSNVEIPYSSSQTIQTPYFALKSKRWKCPEAPPDASCSRHSWSCHLHRTLLDRAVPLPRHLPRPLSAVCLEPRPPVAQTPYKSDLLIHADQQPHRMRVHPAYSPTLAEWRSPSRTASTTSTYFKDARASS